MDAIYLDHSATTPMLPDVWEAMQPFAHVNFGNAASSHRFGRAARIALDEARERVAHLLDAHPEEVLFTSGATEANNLALFGLAASEPGVIVRSPIEHPCVSEPFAHLGHEQRCLPIGSDGVARPFADGWPNPLRLVAVMLGNHETGALQPVAELAHDLAGRAPFHCDAAAVVGKVPVSFATLGVTSLTLGAHKFHGPKGVGVLLLRRNHKLRPLHFGGQQQHGKRPGTEPVALAVGLATALGAMCANLENNLFHVQQLRSRFLATLRRDAAPVVVNGPETGGIPHILNVSFPGCLADALLIALDLAGVACSTGSACSSGSLLPSPVLRAMNVPPGVLTSAMRFSFSFQTTENEIDESARRIIKTVQRLRQSSSNDA